MKIDMNLLKQLRDITFAPLGDCKQALEDANLDLDKAQELLRKKWLAKAWKKADRETKEWIAKLLKKDWRSYWVKLLCETDFVAKNENFQWLVETLLNKVYDLKKNIKSLNDIDTSSLEEMNTIVQESIVKVWENMKLADVVMTNENTYIYNHPWNKVVSIVSYEWDENVAKEVALQVVAMSPACVSVDEVDPELMKKMVEEFTEELKASWKPANVIENIVKWKLNKTYSDFVLLEQEYIRDWSKKVKDILPAWFKVNSFVRLAVY